MDKKTRTRLILNILKKQPAVTLRDLAKAAKVSVRTIQSDIKDINDELRRRQIRASIVTSKKGVVFDVEDEEGFKAFEAWIIIKKCRPQASTG